MASARCLPPALLSLLLFWCLLLCSATLLSLLSLPLLPASSACCLWLSDAIPCVLSFVFLLSLLLPYPRLSAQEPKLESVAFKIFVDTTCAAKYAPGSRAGGNKPTAKDGVSIVRTTSKASRQQFEVGVAGDTLTARSPQHPQSTASPGGFGGVF